MVGSQIDVAKIIIIIGGFIFGGSVWDCHTHICD